ncbi:hypothetical protein [Tenacibaculum sp. 190524A05c]|uniref:Peptide modification target (TIGR04139 family) n=1 Tax=Tenacibaculum platacis TaxID=3137852 RepID=A0ABM9NXT6_9FLAO
MLKRILKLDGVKELTKNETETIQGKGGIGAGSGSTGSIGSTLSEDDKDYWTPGGKFACYTRYQNPNSFSHISNYDETGSVYICWPY